VRLACDWREFHAKSQRPLQYAGLPNQRHAQCCCSLAILGLVASRYGNDPQHGLLLDRGHDKLPAVEARHRDVRLQQIVRPTGQHCEYRRAMCCHVDAVAEATKAGGGHLQDRGRPLPSEVPFCERVRRRLGDSSKRECRESGVQRAAVSYSLTTP
jgi:hypothetical protein